jgi:DNA-binding Xre family transcriptional regulator
MTDQMPTHWRLAVLMAEHKVSNKALAEAVGLFPTSISRLKTADRMPRLSGDQLDALAAGLTKCSKRGGVIRGIDLLEDRPE